MNVLASQLEPWAVADRQPRIAIIGAGMSGIAAVVKLRKAGYTHLTVYEGPGARTPTRGCPATCPHAGTRSALP